MNNSHYFDSVDPIKEEMLREEAKSKGFTEPKFVGQGCCHRSGSDRYGYYVAKIFNSKLIAIVRSEDKMAVHWTDGSMNCRRPSNWQNAECWIYLAKYGKRWYLASPKTLKRCVGTRNVFPLSFNGAYSYLDPSF